RQDPRRADAVDLRPWGQVAGRERPGCVAPQRFPAIQQQRVLRWRLRPLRVAAEGRRRGVRSAGAWLGSAERRHLALDRRLHLVRVPVHRPGPDRLPAWVAVRNHHTPHARPPGLDGPTCRLRTEATLESRFSRTWLRWIGG